MARSNEILNVPALPGVGRLAFAVNVEDGRLSGRTSRRNEDESGDGEVGFGMEGDPLYAIPLTAELAV
jgi:hypothetical protein